MIRLGAVFFCVWIGYFQIYRINVVFGAIGLVSLCLALANKEKIPALFGTDVKTKIRLMYFAPLPFFVALVLPLQFAISFLFSIMMIFW